MDATRSKVIRHYIIMSICMPQFAPHRMAELAPGVVAVEDLAGECDVFFDAARWVFKNPTFWEPDYRSVSQSLQTSGLKILEGLSRIPQITTIEEMSCFAQQHIVSTSQEKWHASPIFFDE